MVFLINQLRIMLLARQQNTSLFLWLLPFERKSIRPIFPLSNIEKVNEVDKSKGDNRSDLQI